MTETDQVAWDEYDRLRDQLVLMREELRAEGDTAWTAQDMAGWLDRVIDGEPAEDADPLHGPLAALLASDTLASQALLFVRPRVAIDVVNEIADVVAASPMRCPVHDSLDCSALLNGCDLPATIPVSVAAYIRSATDGIQEAIDAQDGVAELNGAADGAGDGRADTTGVTGRGGEA